MELCDFGAEFFVLLADLFELFFKTRAAPGMVSATLAVVLLLMLVAFHFLGTGADAARFIVESGCLEVLGGGHQVRQGGFGMRSGAGTAFTGTFLAGTASTGATFAGWRGTIPIARRGGSVGLAGFSFGTTFGTTFAGRAGLFSAEFGLVTGFPFFRAGFGAGGVLLSASGEGSQPEGGGDGGSEEGAAEVD